MYETGKVDLDTDIKKYLDTLNLKYYTNNSVKVTCRNLLTHTGGLPMHYNYYYDDDTVNTPSIEQVIDKFDIVVTTPSVKYNYANLGYGMLGYIISKVSKKDFNEYMTEEIFQPLGMDRTTADISLKTTRKLAKRYGSNGELLPFSFSDTPGAANISTTAKDLVHFGMFHLGNYSGSDTLLKISTIKKMQQKQFPDTLSTDEVYTRYYNRNKYGLGWFINNTDYKYKVVYHAGGMDGVDAMLKLVPEKNIAVVVLINQFSMNPAVSDQISDSILLAMLPDYKNTEKQKTNFKPREKVIKQEDLTGTWTGNIETCDQKVPIKLIFLADGDIHIYTNAQFNTGQCSLPGNNVLSTFKTHKMLLNKWFFYDGHFMGTYPLSIPGEHLSRCPHSETWLDLRYRSGKLIGTASAHANSNRMYYGISWYLELEKVKQGD